MGQQKRSRWSVSKNQLKPNLGVGDYSRRRKQFNPFPRTENRFEDNTHLILKSEEEEEEEENNYVIPTNVFQERCEEESVFPSEKQQKRSRWSVSKNQLKPN